MSDRRMASGSHVLDAFAVTNRVEATLVAFYGGKDGPLADLIGGVQGILRKRLGMAFTPYALEQVHGTIIGLEASCTPQGPVHAKCLGRYGDDARVMDLAEIWNIICQLNEQPLRIQIGGYQHWAHYGFDSRGMHPYVRSFWFGRGAQPRALEAVIMGWPVGANLAWRPLDALRRRFEVVNVVHKYHDTPVAVDDDFYMVIGTVDDRPGLGEVAANVRTHMANIIVPLEVAATHLSVVRYQEPTLPLDDGTDPHPASTLTIHDLERLYICPTATS